MGEEEEEGGVAATDTSVHLLAGAACGDMALQREAPDVEALEEDTVRAETEAALVGDEMEGRRRSL